VTWNQLRQRVVREFGVRTARCRSKVSQEAGRDDITYSTDFGIALDAASKGADQIARKILFMRRTFVATFAVGLILALFGLIWALQGFGVLGGSQMSNTTTWSISGPITALIGIVIAVVSWRKLSSK
jgi:hypothetical protein